MEIIGNFDTKTNQWVLTPKQLNLVVVKTGENSFMEVKSASDIDILRQIS